MVVIDNIDGDADFEYHGNSLAISFKGRNTITDEVVDVCISQWACESLQSAVIRALDIILVSQVPKEALITGTLMAGAE